MLIDLAKAKRRWTEKKEHFPGLASHSRVGSELFVRVKSERENSTVALGLGHLGANAFLSRLNCFLKRIANHSQINSFCNAC